MDDKKYTPEFTPTVAIKTPIASPFINKTESTRNPVKFNCTGVIHQERNGNADYKN